MSNLRHSKLALTHIEHHEESDAARPFSLETFRRLFRYTDAYSRKRTALFAITALRSLQLPLLVWVISAVISGPVEHGDMRGLIAGTTIFALLAIFTQVTMHFRARLALELGASVVNDLRNDIFEHLQTLTTSFYDRTRIGRVISRMTSDLESVRIGVQDIVFISIVQGGQMIVSAILMLWIDWALFLVLLVMAPVVWLLNRHFTKKLAEAHRNMQASFSRVTSTLAESVGGIRVTQSFVRQDLNAGFFRELVTDHSRYNMGAARTTAVFLPLLELNSQIFIALLLIIGGYRVLTPSIHVPAGDIVQFFFLANLFFEPIRVIGNQYTQALAAIVGAERVFQLLDTEVDWKDAPDARELPAIEGLVEFEDVSFRYDPSQLILKNVSFRAAPGEMIALVGHTGSGKTSIINLVNKAYLPTSGQILIDGFEIRAISSPSLHRQLAIVQQQNFLFEDTVMENVRYGRPNATDEEVIDAVRTLDFLDLIEALPGGFATAIGEGGSGLSAGQRQLVCFARALIANPRILILDEATSSIDSMTEQRIQKSLETLLKGRTSFVIAHRLSTIRQADQILVLDHGRIAERGRHMELIAQDGIYAALHENFTRSAG